MTHSLGTPTIVVAVTERHLGRFLCDNLTADGYDAIEAVSASVAAELLAAVDVALLLVELELPDRSGVEMLTEIRSGDGTTSRIDPGLPVIALTGIHGDLHTVRVIDRGADDVVKMPFSYPELRARIGALLRRSERRRAGALRVGDLVVDPVSRTATLAGEPLLLTSTEFSLLRHLAAEPQRAYTKPELQRAIWNASTVNVRSSRTLDSHACRLRRKLTTPGGPKYVHNVWGVGYRLLDGEQLPALIAPLAPATA